MASALKAYLTGGHFAGGEAVAGRPDQTVAASFLAEAAGITATVAKRIASMLLLSSSMAATTNITLALRN